MAQSTEQNPITVIGKTNFRNEEKTFGIRRADRRAHMYVIGKTGTGKSTLLKNLIVQDIQRGEGCALLDPHGDLVRAIVERVPESRRGDLIYFDVTNAGSPLAFNPLQVRPNESKALVASNLIATFKKMWSDFWGPRMEYILRNTLLALLDRPESTLLDVPRLFTDLRFRSQVLDSVSSEQVRDFWLREYPSYSPYFRAEAAAPIQNKIGEFLVNPVLRRIVEQPKSSFDLREVMDSGKMLLINLAKGQIGEDSASLLGSLLLGKLTTAALSRAEISEEERCDFYLYVDEFPSFATSSFATMLAEMRKYRLSLVLAHQYLTQIDEKTRDAILGNVGTTIAFRVGASDAELLEKEFAPELGETDLVSLPNYQIYLKLMIDGVVSRPFSKVTEQIHNC